MNYIGSKYSLLGFLQSSISEVVQPSQKRQYVFADLFAGTGVVGSQYKSQGYKVISNDIQYYSYVINKHFIANSNSIDLSYLDYFNSLNGIDGFIYKNYCSGSGSGRNYFSDRNGRRCDAIRLELERLFESGEICEETYFFYLASLLNSIDKYANTASVYGAFLKHTKRTAENDFSLEPLPIIEGIQGSVYNDDTNNLIRSLSGDILYLDPPYNKRQYCSNYHVLETIARYDNPPLKGITGMRDYSLQKSQYCSTKTAALALDDLIANADFKYVFLSYNNEGIIPFETIKDIMSGYGTYKQFSLKYRRFKADKDSRRNITSDSTVEYLHCLIKEG